MTGPEFEPGLHVGPEIWAVCSLCHQGRLLLLVRVVAMFLLHQQEITHCTQTAAVYLFAGLQGSRCVLTRWRTLPLLRPTLVTRVDGWRSQCISSALATCVEAQRPGQRFTPRWDSGSRSS